MIPGLLTRKLDQVRAQAPYVDYSPAIYRTVFTAILRSWRGLVDHEGEALAHYSEVEVTACMQVVLEELRLAAEPAVPGFTSKWFETVTRDGSMASYDGHHLEKQPDFTIRLIDRHPGLRSSLYRGIFVECKIVGSSFPVRLYCNHGIGRFVRGEYAWAMPTGVMVAYARDQHTVGQNLVPLLAQHSKDGSTDPFLTKSLPTVSSNFSVPSARVFSSIHARPHSQNGRPGAIQLHHLWLG